MNKAIEFFKHEKQYYKARVIAISSNGQAIEIVDKAMLYKVKPTRLISERNLGHYTATIIFSIG